MNLQESAIAATEKSLEVLLYTIGRTPDERLTWKPCETARSALEIAAECALVTSNWVDILASRMCPPSDEYFKIFSRLEEFSSREKVVSGLQTETARLTSVLRALTDEQLSQELKMFWGEAAPLGNWLHWVAIHNSYHLGQINYIQRLYGDTED
jgi:uncharacterized damage-inducible protein DinB